MGLLSFFRKKKEEKAQTPSSAGPWSQPLDADQSLSPFNMPQAMQQQQSDTLQKDLQLIATKLDVVPTRLETLSRQFELLQHGQQQVPPGPQVIQQPYPRRW